MKCSKVMRRFLALLGVASLGLVGCGGGSDSGAAMGCGPLAQPQTLQLGVNPGAQDMVTFVMQEQGFDKKHNLNLEISEFQNPSALHSAIGQRTVDVGFAGLTAMATAREQGRDTMIFDVLTSPSNVIVTRNDSNVHSLSDLKGRKLGVFGGRTSATFAIASIVAKEKYGIQSLDKDVQLIEGPDAAVLGLLDEGNIDAALIGTTATVQALLSGKYRVLSDISEDYQSKFGNLPGHVLAATTDEYAEKNCGVLNAFSAALDDTVAFIQHDEKVWSDYAANIKLTDPRAPATLRERVASRYIPEWNQAQADAEAALINQLIPVLGADKFVPAVPDGLFRVDLRTAQ
ncbi:ABC transporter substrate-binding protein [Saccharopolyspora sp. K220]|uniref:ABC transporter substrate-binding protein n=1 Tax=Saccharopolyspora soli TaxID=2926618 RepID=UPI001F5A341C|nr:ABC transporter substrate-binding protein [Saccharopolyspora soli]MCI2423183.1 ABC transporter substrate-binding protein [Saccharopolyspora soli]